MDSKPSSAGNVWRWTSLITLTNALPLSEDDPIVIMDGKQIKIFTPDRSTPQDCTRVLLNDGSTFLVQESVDEIEDLLANEKK
jgi:precorrin-6B methylase 1